MSKLDSKKLKKSDSGGLFKNPFFYFGVFAVVLLGLLSYNSDSLAKLNSSQVPDLVFLNSLLKGSDNSDSGVLFFSQSKTLTLEPPDFKIIQDDSIYGISTPRVLTTQTLGDIFWGDSHNNKKVVDYSVQPGDTLESIAQEFGVSVNTLVWANDNISKNSDLKVGQTLVVLPVSGFYHIVKSGDTISQIAKTYKASSEEIIAFNNLTSEGDIFIGDPLIIPGGVKPQKPVNPIIEVPLADSFFIYPTEGRISQGLHWYNAVDIANKCSSPVYAAASGTVQRVRYGWNSGGGNQITILHSDNIVTYYGHLLTIGVKAGDKVNVGERIGLVGNNGISTGCHLHFGVAGAKNPLAKYSAGTSIKYK